MTAPPTNGQAPHIILVDDDEAVLGSLKFAFETDGFTVAGFSRAEAVPLEPTPGRVCFVLDQNLSGMSGLELVVRLRARGVEAPAIIITTNPSEALQAHALAIGVEIVEKPLLGETLRRTVKRLLRLDEKSGE